MSGINPTDPVNTLEKQNMTKELHELSKEELCLEYNRRLNDNDKLGTNWKMYSHSLELQNERLKAENEALLYSLRKLLHHALDEHYLAHDPDGYVKQADDLVDKIMSER